MPKIRDLSLCKCALGQLHLPLIAREELKYCPQMCQMVSKRAAVDENIVEEHQNAFAEEGLQSRVHGALEGGRSATEAK